MSVTENEVNEPTRVKNFAKFFKNYMSIWSVVVAALPMPITAFSLIPVFEVQKSVLSTYTTLFCFLLLGFIFYSRHWMAKFFFPGFYYITQKRITENELMGRATSSGPDEERKVLENDLQLKRRRAHLFAKFIHLLPLILILMSILSAFYYNSLIESYMLSGGGRNVTRAALLEAQYLKPDLSTLLMVSYLSIFVFAEAAFILMAVKEYIQDLLHIKDETVMMSLYDAHRKARTAKASAEKEMGPDMPEESLRNFERQM